MAKKIKLTNDDDVFKGKGKDEIINAKAGDDSVSGGGGNDTIKGGAGNDVLKGGAGDDTLNGGADNDILLGGAGDDRLIGGKGDNTVDGGEGDDTVVMTGNLADATITKDADGRYVFTTADGTTTVENVELFQFADGTVDSSKIDDIVNGSTGVNIILTAGADIATGSSGDDTISGVVDAQTVASSTLTAADNITGADGIDNLSITTQGNVAVADIVNGAQVAGVESVTLRAVSTAGATFNANNVVGLAAFNNNLSTDAVTVTNLADPAVVTVTGNGSVVNGATTVSYVAGATSGELVLTGGVNGGAVAVNGAGLTSLTIDSKGAANTAAGISTTGTPATVTINAETALNTGGVTVGALATAQTLAVNGAAANQAATAALAARGAVTLGTVDAAIDVLNASGLTAGGIDAVLSATTTLAVTGGKGDDTITTGSVLTTGSVAAGDGAGDRLVLAATAHLATAALGAKYTGFEQLQVQGSQVANLANIAGITSVLLNDDAGATEFQNLTAAQAGAITVLASDGSALIGVSGASTVGQIDTVKMTFSDGDTTGNEDINTTASTFTLTGVENLQVVATDAVEITQTNAASGDLTSVTLSGAGNISFTTGNMDQVNFSLNASASTGTNILNASAFATNGVAITGGSGVDTITGSAQADLIIGGAGADSITGGAGVDVMTGGDGKDVFIFATADVDTTLGAVTDTITDFLTKNDTIDGSFGAGTALNYVEAAAAVADLATLLTAADAALNSTVDYYVGQVGSDSYLVTDDNGTGYTEVIKLTGVALTGIEFADIV